MKTLNLPDQISGNPHFRQLTVADVLFAEYSCPLEDERVGIWTHTDYLIHVISGKKTWHTTSGSWTAAAGQTLFFKKGAAIIEQFFDEQFCLLALFIPDSFVREVVRDLADELRPNPEAVDQRAPAIDVKEESFLTAYFESMRPYLSLDGEPPTPLLRLKAKELVTGVLVSEVNRPLAAYLQSQAGYSAPSLSDIMETNFRYSLSIQDFSRLCHRSLSSFKRDFQKHYGEAPGKWLLRRRLEYSAMLLKSADMNVTQIMFESGFEDSSHFSRAFRSKFGMSPTAYRSTAMGRI